MPSRSHLQTFSRFLLGAFVLAFPLVTGELSWFSNRNVFWSLMGAATLGTIVLMVLINPEPILWTPLRRILAVTGGVTILYGTALLAATYGLSRPAFLFLPLIALGVATVLFRPVLLEQATSRGLRLAFTGLIFTVTACCLLSKYQHVAIEGNDFRKTGLLTFLASTVLFLLVTMTVQSARIRNHILMAAVCGGSLASAIALWQFCDLPRAQEFFLNLHRDPRPMGTLGHPNWFGTYLCLILPLACGLFLQTQRPSAKTWSLIASALLFGALLVCQTRGAWLAGGVFLLGLVFSCRRQWQKILPLLLVFTIVTSILLPAKNWEIFQRMGTFGRQVSLASEGSPATGSSRFLYWSYGIQHLRAHLLLGPGLDTYPEVGREDMTPPPVDKAHSLYLEYAVTLGLPGLALYLFLLWQCLRGLPRPSTTSIEWALKASLATYLVQGIFIHDTIQTWPLVWIIAGLAAIRGGVSEKSSPAVSSKPPARLGGDISTLQRVEQ